MVTMSLAILSSPTVRIVCGLFLIACVATSKSESIDKKGDKDVYKSDENSSIIAHSKQKLIDKIDLNEDYDEDLKNEELPILPPIILLDFVNGTANYSSNFTNHSNEKSKRTIDDNLGYGFNHNSLFSGKHNYYFPAGKTGTAVSIEESISPFAPKTVTELVKPITEKTREDDTKNNQNSKQPLFEVLPDPLPLQNDRELTPIYPPYPVFGQRTKLHKTTSSNFEQNQGRFPSKPFSGFYNPAATPGTNAYAKFSPTYTQTNGNRPSDPSGLSSSVNINGYARPMSSVISNYMPYIYNNNKQSSFDSRPSQTANPSANQNFKFSNYPKYTIENGIKYEHKTVWKYPDGKISETPPTSYINSYTEFAKQGKVDPSSTGGFHPSILYQPRPMTSYMGVRGTSFNQYGNNAQSSFGQSNIHSQKPVQFPNDQEQSSENQGKVTPKKVGITYESYFQAMNLYNSPVHQGQYEINKNTESNGYRPITGTNSQIQFTNHRMAPQYMTNSPNPEYVQNEENKKKENLFTTNGQINKQVLSKYTPEVQQYLMKVFSAGKTPTQTNYQTDGSESFANTDYSNLLNYNPSISQYIRNPASILNAQPTFIQAGNSLIPVIILRVDGTPPVQPKVQSNINLKSLLRQYLTQYANSVSKFAQNTNYDFGSTINDEEVSASQQNPVEDLKYLTESLASLRGHQNPDFANKDYTQIKLQQQQLAKPQKSTEVQGEEITSNYNRYIKDYQKIHSAQQVRKPSQKVKSVQIIEDPRYTSYKVES